MSGFELSVIYYDKGRAYFILLCGEEAMITGFKLENGVVV